MPRPKIGEQIAVANHGRVIINRNRLRMISYRTISRLLFLTPAVTRPRAQNSLQASELGIRSPKSSHPESRGFKGYFGCRFIER